MICPKCDNNVNKNKTICEKCGTDLSLHKKIIRLSNMYYNQGLERARIRDLSGAIITLKNSLKLNKRNYKARNLLGLIYFETGEVVKALSEWVISKHFKPDNNEAEYYLNAIQNNPGKLESFNNIIKRYNQALLSAKQHNDDIAVIQLKKVISINPNYITALNLLALLYIKNNEYKKAKRYLNRTREIDITNIKTLKYINEIEQQLNQDQNQNKEKDREMSLNDNDVEFSVVPVSSYKEDRPNIMAFINLILGVLIGVVAMYILVIPTIKREYDININNKYAEYNAAIAKQQDQDDVIAALRDEKEEMQGKIDKLNKDIDSIVIPDVNDNLKVYNELFDAIEIYTEGLSTNDNETLLLVADKLSMVDKDMLETTKAKEAYDSLIEVSYPVATNVYYREGYSLYNNNKFEEALEKLLQSYKYDENNIDSIYFLGRSYHRLNDNENAKLYYEMLINNHQDTRRASQAKEKLTSLR